MISNRYVTFFRIAGLLSLLSAGGYVWAQNMQGPRRGQGGQFGGPPVEQAIPLPESKMSVVVRDNYRYITSNGIPDHAPGEFPNPGNPNAIRPQNHSFRATLQPTRAEQTTPIRRYWFGIAVNGVPFEPATGEFWNNDRRWNYDALSGKINLGIDAHSAHVQPGGVYHYHGVPTGVVAKTEQKNQMTMVGIAGDGFPIYALNGHAEANNPKSGLKKLRSSYRLKEGTRPDGADGPGGVYDGTFNSDWEYVAGSGELDECNGRTGVTPDYPQGTYYYVLTDHYPFMPRSFRGTPDETFKKVDGGPPGGGNRPGGGGPNAGGPNAGGPNAGGPNAGGPNAGGAGRPGGGNPNGGGPPGGFEEEEGNIEPLPDPKVTIEEREGFRYITSNGVPNHVTGKFPHRGNPSRIEAQDHKFRVPLKPVVGEASLVRHANFGVAVNGIPFNPATNEFWNNNRAWNYDALSGKIYLGTDSSNAHVQPGGIYHYHGLPHGLIEKVAKKDQMTFLGYAADGFPIYAIYGHTTATDAKSPLKKLTSSYRLKQGTRPGGTEGPGGTYDGTFSADWEYVEGAGDLDECNGRTGVTAEYPDGTYYYVLTHEYPFVPRVFRGTPDPSFSPPRPAGGANRPGGGGGPNGGGPNGGGPDEGRPHGDGANRHGGGPNGEGRPDRRPGRRPGGGGPGGPGFGGPPPPR